MKIKHNLYKTGDKGAPVSILDKNNEVVLALCKKCNKGEADLKECCDFVTIKWSGGEPWSNAEKSWYVLVSEGVNGGWSTGFWFPKKCCQLDPEGLLTLPQWLFDKLGLGQIATVLN